MNLDNRLKSIKAIAKSRLDFTYNFVAESVTLDGNWHTKTISEAKLVLLGLEWWTSGIGDSAYFYTRKNGSSQTWEGILRSATGDYGGGQGSMILQPCDGDGKYQYKGGGDSGTLIVRRIGYFS